MSEQMEDAGKPGTARTKGTMPKGLQGIMSWVAVVILTSFGVYLLVKLQRIGIRDPNGNNFWHDIVREQIPAMVGIPMAGMAALFMTLVLRAANGPLEFEAMGMKFKGGSGPIVFWILCFIVIVSAIKLLWI